MAKRVEHNLDDPEVYPRLDPSGLRKRLRDLPGHCRAAWKQAKTAPLPGDWTDSDKVVSRWNGAGRPSPAIWPLTWLRPGAAFRSW